MPLSRGLRRAAAPPRRRPPHLRYADALGAYAEAYALTRDPALLYNQGRAHQALGNFPEALASFERFAVEASPDLRARVARTAQFRGIDAETLLNDPPEGFVVGTLEQAADQLREYERAGAQRMLCQHNPHDDLEFVELLGRELAPLVA